MGTTIESDGGSAMAQLGAARAAIGASIVPRARINRVIGFSISPLTLSDRVVNGARETKPLRIGKPLLSLAAVIFLSDFQSAHGQIIENRKSPANTPGLECRYATQANPTVYANPTAKSKMLGYISKGVLAQDGPVVDGWVPTVTGGGIHGWVPEFMTYLKGGPGFPHRCHVVREASGRLVFYLGV